ncbi:T9SS type A sorting domain-containing protein [Chondrinema litorale]|nr:ELWxxDGT repeat protein [Chondrinema litorale]UZR96257.1 T9SS type A sorting domain-containing protein [Chondrinema litorale]
MTFKDKFYFVADDGEHGLQIWYTDGSESGTKMLTAISTLNTAKLTTDDDYIYFLNALDSGEDGEIQLWRSDGSTEGTIMVKDEIPNYRGTYPYVLQVSLNGLIYFNTVTNNNTYDIWRSDGTEEGTYSISEFWDEYDFDECHLINHIVFKNELYFVYSKKDETGLSIILNKTGGNAENSEFIEKLTFDDLSYIYFSDIIVIEDDLFLSLYDQDQNQLTLLKFNADDKKFEFIFNNKNSQYFSPSYLSNYNNNLLFTKGDANGNTVFATYNIEDSQLSDLKEIFNFQKSTTFTINDVVNIKQIDSSLFAVFVPEIDSLRKAWVLDLLNSNHFSNAEFCNVEDVFSTSEKIVFTKKSKNIGVELWETDINLVKVERLKSLMKLKLGLTISEPTPIKNKLYFRASTDTTGFELWVFDDSLKNLSLVKDIYSGSLGAYPQALIDYNDSLFFFASSENDYGQLFKTNGSEEGTNRVSNIENLYVDFSNRFLVEFQNQLFFSAIMNDTSYLMSSNSSEVEAISNLKYISPGLSQFRYSGHDGVSTDNFVYFYYGGDLWRSNGKQASTFKILEIFSIENLTALDSSVYFSGKYLADSENVLWTSIGDFENTKRIKTINEEYLYSPQNLVSFNGKLVFTAYTSEYGRELWITDGSPDSTYMIADINPGIGGVGDLNGYAELGGYLYFSATDGVNGVELWKTDGTLEGTMMVKDLNTGSEGSYPSEFISDGQKVYFTAYSKENGVELWVTYGAEQNTIQLYDVILGTRGSIPENLMFINGELYFTADTESEGRQIWKLDSEVEEPDEKNSDEEDENDVTAIDDLVDDEIFTLYPNPGAEYIRINVEGINVQQVQVFNLNGQSVEFFTTQHNEIYIGNLPKGMYFFVVNTGDKKLVRKFLKE